MINAWQRVLVQPFLHFRKTLRGLVLGGMVLGIIFSLNQLNYARLFPIQTVQIYGVSHLTQSSVESALTPLVDRGFFAVNVDAVRERLKGLPWVADAAVRRVWPNHLTVEIAEKQPVASWNKSSVLSESGELFVPDEDASPANLVEFNGPEGGQILMLQYFYQINRTLAPLHVNILSLTLTPYMTWKLALDNGITLQIGHKDILTRLAQFVKVYPKIIGTRATDVDYVDLRYSNGIAVRWKKPVKT
jgi:cell division protein FtsQ